MMAGVRAKGESVSGRKNQRRKENPGMRRGKTTRGGPQTHGRDRAVCPGISLQGCFSLLHASYYLLLQFQKENMVQGCEQQFQWVLDDKDQYNDMRTSSTTVSQSRSAPRTTACRQYAHLPFSCPRVLPIRDLQVQDTIPLLPSIYPFFQ